MTSYIIVLFALYGALIGSFLNVCIYRLPRKMNITTDRSHCTSCGHQLAARDLVPVFSYLALKRKCRYCSEPISSRYAIIETATMAVFAAIAAVMGPTGLDIKLGQAVLLAVTASALIVWSMIRFDDNKPPVILYFWLFIPAFINAMLEADRLLHLVGLLSMLLTALLLYVLRLWQLQLRHPGHEIIIAAAGGLMTAWPGTAIFGGLTAIMLAILNVWINRNRNENLQPGRWLAPMLALFSLCGALLHHGGATWFS
ncbi:MAG: prepilin peptidase [Clostridiaceae bacterium]|nr:prepilin peptidase [Clostridiaceae bacterium]